MTSMRMRLLFSLSFVHVLVRYIGGEGGGGVRGWGGGRGVMTSMRMHVCFLFLFSPCSNLFWCGTYVKATSVFCSFA